MKLEEFLSFSTASPAAAVSRNRLRPSHPRPERPSSPRGAAIRGGSAAPQCESHEKVARKTGGRGGGEIKFASPLGRDGERCKPLNPTVQIWTNKMHAGLNRQADDWMAEWESGTRYR